MIKKEPFVVIIVSNYNGATIKYEGRPILERCLSSLGKTVYKNFKVIVADDSSIDNSKFLAKKILSSADFVINRPNGGFAKNNNNAIRYALAKYKPEYVLLLNNDIIVRDRFWISKMVDSSLKDKKVGIVGCKLLYPNGTVQHAGTVIKPLPYTKGNGETNSKKYSKIERVDAVIGAAMMLNSTMLAEIGFLDENFVMGGEDTDLCLRASSRGYKILYNGEASLIHLSGFSSINSHDNDERLNSVYLNMRNTVYLMQKHKRTYRIYDRIMGYLIYITWSVLTIKGPSDIMHLHKIRSKGDIRKRLKFALMGYYDGIALSKRQSQADNY